MGFIPEGATWFVADLVTKWEVEDDDESELQTSLVLVSATTAEDAYTRALALGKDAAITFTNSDGKRVVVTFLGLRDLNVVHDRLEHGAELAWDATPGGMANEKRLVSTKAELGVFRPLTPRTPRTPRAQEVKPGA